MKELYSSHIVTLDTPELQQFVTVLLEEAFPKEERREIVDFWNIVFTHANVDCSVIFHGTNPAGFYCMWDFNSFAYLEFIAIGSSYRSKGLFSTFFGTIAKKYQKYIICEAERCDTTQAKRRLGLYERLGFDIISNTYMQPPFRKEDEAQPMYLLGYTNNCAPITPDNIIENLYCNVYGVVS